MAPLLVFFVKLTANPSQFCKKKSCARHGLGMIDEKNIYFGSFVGDEYLLVLVVPKRRRLDYWYMERGLVPFNTGWISV